MDTPQDIISYLLPFVATAGAYSARVQGQVGTHADKDGETPFHQALSDADLTIQGYLEVVLLAKYPHLSFFSEEQAQSLNARHFAPDHELEVLLDPIDGTRSYIDGRTHYQIIVTIHDRSDIVGSLCYMPRRDRCYVATRGGGAYVLSTEEMQSGARGAPLRLSPDNNGPVLGFHMPDLVAKLAPLMEVKDLAQVYQSHPGRFHSTDLLEGLAAATLHRACQAIDGGSIALIAEEAGAIVSDFGGKPLKGFRDSPKRTVPNAIVAANREIHSRIVSALSQ